MAASMKKIILVIQSLFPLFLQLYKAEGYVEISMTDNSFSDCYEVFHDPGGIIKAYGSYLDLGTFDCQVTIVSRDSTQKYELRFDTFEVYSEDGLCDDHHLQMFDGYDRAARPLTNKLCLPEDDPTRRDLPKPVYTSGEAVTLYLYRYDPPGPSNFKIIFTAFKREDDGECFKCLNNSAMCIDGDLTCDSLKHCTDGSDESSEGKGGCSESTGMFTGVSFAVMISIVAVVSIVLIIVAIALCVYCCRRPTKTPRYTSNAIYKPTTKIDYPRTQNSQSYPKYDYYPTTENDYAMAQTPSGYPSQVKQGSSAPGTPRHDSSQMSYITEQDDVSMPLKTDTLSTRS